MRESEKEKKKQERDIKDQIFLFWASSSSMQYIPARDILIMSRKALTSFYACNLQKIKNTSAKYNPFKFFKTASSWSIRAFVKRTDEDIPFLPIKQYLYDPLFSISFLVVHVWTSKYQISVSRLFASS